MPDVDSKAHEMRLQLQQSQSWMENTYWGEWEEAYKNYKCIVDPRLDADGNEDPDKTNIGMPDTFAMVNRRTARITANIPDVKFISKNRNSVIDNSVSMKIMWDWDNGKVQRQQKRHVRQAELFGWSVRAWSWQVEEFERRRGIDISDPFNMPQEDLDAIARTFQIEPQRLADPEGRIPIISTLASKTRRGLLDIRYTYKAYEGPRAETLFVGDCFPEPFFEDLQSAGWFIMQRRRNEEWLKALAKRYPHTAPGIQKLMEDYPDGTQAGSTMTRDQNHFADKLRKTVGYQTTADQMDEESKGAEKKWTIIERWKGGRRTTVSYAGEGTVWIGEVTDTYIIDGKKPFTELILCDDIMGGIGDSVSRITRGLQQMHNVATNRRFDLYRQVTQPWLFTSDRQFYDNPEMLRRDLMRLVLARGGPGSVWMLNEGQAMAAMASSMGEEAAHQRMFQMASGDSNMSMAANVDPAQLRTATGAKLLQANQDVLSKDLSDMFNLTSVTTDAEMIYLLNRSEMADAVEIDPGPYTRNYSPNVNPEKLEWIRSENIHFQVDGKLIAKLGSTMADDDEANVAKATNLFQMLQGNPFANQEQLTQDLLIAHGKGPELQKYMQAPQPGPPPIKMTASVSVPFETLGQDTQRAILEQGGISQENIQKAQQELMQEAAAASGQVPMEGPPPMGPEAGAPPPEIDPTQLLAAEQAGML